MADQNSREPVRGAGPHPKPVATPRRQVDRSAAIRRVRAAQRKLVPRNERFAHLSRMHD